MLYFIPYLGLYLIFWWLALPSSSLGPLFQILHFAVFLRLAKVGLTTQKKLPLLELAIWIGIFLFLLLPGAYLEYPSDSWEHFRRIFRWQDPVAIGVHEDDLKFKFAYFFSYTLVSWVPILDRRIALGFLSAIWQLLLSIQIFRLALRLGLTKELSYLQTLGFLFLFGTNIFGVRYYALGSTPLAYAAYLECLLVLLEPGKRSPTRRAFEILLLSILIFFNHIQELCFLLLSGSVIVGYRYVQRLDRTGVRSVIDAALPALLAGFALGPVLVTFLDFAYQKMIPGQVNALGMFRVWESGYSFYIQTLGVQGWLGVLCAILLIRRYPLPSLLALAPIFSLVYPPTVLLIASLFPSGYLTYRVLFALPLSFPLLIMLYELAKLFRLARFTWALAFVALVLLSYPHEFPWRGRLWFQLYQPPEERTLSALDQTAEWFSKNRDPRFIRDCFLLTDDASRTAVMFHLGGTGRATGGEPSRRGRKLDGREYKSADSLAVWANWDQPFCGVLAAETDKLPESAHSPVAALSGHWYQYQADLRWLSTKEFESAAAKLPGLGWQKVFVPPFYNFYEPPTRPTPPP